MSEAEPSPDPKPTPRLGSYVLIKQLGSGGMSNVFRAVHEETGNIVAVKVLPRTLAKNLTLLERFIREAKSAEALDHPNIAAIYDRGFDQGRHYLVLEYVEGNDLHDRVRMNGPLNPNEAVRFVREVAEGLHYAATLKMIHRDVKPANLLMTPDGHAKIIDLGLALQTDDEDERVTRDGTTVGTVDYMAPEQARDSRQTSERSDIYSLGCTFYYLLTGSQPYPGGDLADKLSRHYKAPIPDVRETRPELPENLSLLIRRMMEKKPDRRFADYTHLIAALDALSGSTQRSTSPPVVLDALFADDDEDDEIGLLPTEPASRTDHQARPPSSLPLMMAEIVDDDEDDEPPPSKRPEPPKRREPAAPVELSLADLAALDADGDLATRRQGRRVSEAPPSRPKIPTPSMDAILEDDDDEPVEGESSRVRRGGAGELSLQTWIAAGVMTGLAIAVVGFGVFMVISFAKPKPVVEVVREKPEPPVEDDIRDVRIVPRGDLTGPRAPTKPSVPIRQPLVNVPVVIPPVEVVTTDVPPEELAYPQDLEARLGPPPPPVDPSLANRPRVVVRRVIEAGEEVQTPSLSFAFARAGDLVEIADTGPFFEDDFQISGKSRLIRAKPGIRPILKIEPTGQQMLKEQDAKFVLGGGRIETLILEGIDFAVDLRDLPDRQTSLFLCRGAEVVLRDCTITLIIPPDRKTTKFAIFRVEEGARPNRIVLDRSTIRGPIRTLVDLTAARAEIVLDRSVVIGDNGPLIAIDSVEKPTRSLFFHRSVLATRGPILEFSGKASPIPVRSLGTTFARIEGGTSPGLFHLKTSLTGDPRTGLDWSGENNTFDGWPAWLTAGPEPAIKVSRQDGLRVIWPDSDRSSRESTAPWPASTAREEISMVDLGLLAGDRKGTLARIAWPHPRLHDLTFGSIARLPTPELSTTLIPPYVPPPIIAPPPPPVAVAVAPRPAPKNAPSPPTKPTPRVIPKTQPGGGGAGSVPGPIDVVFDVSVYPWSGDLGKFLADTIVPGTTRATIRVRGEGVHPMSPVRLPDGLSITILGTPIEGSSVALPTFIPKSEGVGRSMIELHGGDLGLANLAFSTDGVIRPKHWIWSENGLLAIKHCRFRDQGGASPEIGAMIAFIAPGASPMPPRVGPFQSATDRPTARLTNCLIWTGGDALLAEVGRGVMDLENCLIISGGPAVSLLPGKVARGKFEADLILERCTVSDERTAISLGPWPGDPLGPDRPWLVSTRSCVFPKTQVGPVGSILLVDPEAMARGALFWQSFADAYEVGRFVASIGPTPTSPPPADLKKGWIDLWGGEHARSDRGPDFRRNEHVIRYKDKERPRPGKVFPGALELDPKGQKDLGVDFKLLPMPKV